MTIVISQPYKYLDLVFLPPSEEETEGRPHHSLELLVRRRGGADTDLFTLVTGDRTQGKD